MSQSFRIRALDAFHLVVPDTHYWQQYQSQDRVRTERFVLKPGWRTVYARHVETMLLRVTLADGSVGWGEATEPICPEVVGRLATQLLAPVLGDRDFADPWSLWEAGYDLNRGRGHAAGYQQLALAALDVAVWDALGRRAGRPVAAMLSDTPRARLPVYLSGLRKATLAERIEALRAAVDGGIGGAKLFVDARTEATLAEVAALREAVPGGWALMVDALWSYERPQEAAAARRALDAHRVGWLECPLLPEDLEAHRALAAQPGVPIALGETFFTLLQAEPWLRAGAVQVLQPDIGRTGLSGGHRMRARAESLGVGVTAHMGSGSPVIQAATLQFGASGQGTLLAEYQADLGGMLPAVFDSGWRLEDGAMRLPSRPGLGVEVNLDGLKPHCAQIERWSA